MTNKMCHCGSYLCVCVSMCVCTSFLASVSSLPTDELEQPCDFYKQLPQTSDSIISNQIDSS